MTWSYAIGQLITGAIVFAVLAGMILAIAPWMRKWIERDLEKIAQQKEKEFAEWLWRRKQ